MLCSSTTLYLVNEGRGPYEVNCFSPAPNPDLQKKCQKESVQVAFWEGSTHPSDWEKIFYSLSVFKQWVKYLQKSTYQDIEKQITGTVNFFGKLEIQCRLCNTKLCCCIRSHTELLWGKSRCLIFRTHFVMWAGSPCFESPWPITIDCWGM